jgi:hypothetical protein
MSMPTIRAVRAPTVRGGGYCFVAARHKRPFAEFLMIAPHADRVAPEEAQ